MHYPERFLERTFKELTAIYRTRNQEESDWDDYNQLCGALQRGDTELAQQLITNGAKLNKEPFIFPCNTPLHLAVIMGCPETVQLLIDRGAFLNRKAFRGDTPLIMAAKMGRNAIVDILLSANGTLNTLNEENLNHMHIACMENRVDIVINMIQRGADVNHCVSPKSLYWPGFTPLHFAVLSQKREIVKLLLDNGADILKLDARDLSPLHLAHMIRNEPIIDLILTAHKGLSMNPRSPDGMTHFHIACTRNDTSVVQHFLKMGDYVIDEMVYSPENWRNWRPIDFALYYQCFDVFLLLLSKGARITRDSLRDMMDCVIMQEDESVFNAILQQSRKQDRKKKPLDELSNFHKACYKREYREVKDFLSNNDVMIPINTFLSDRIPYTPLHLMLRRRDEFHARLFLRHGADITVRDANGDTPLHLAFEYGMLDIAKEMVNTLLNPDSNPINSRGLSHFQIACACYDEKSDSNKNLVSDFIRIGVDINGQTSSTCKLWPKYTPLHFAVKFQQLKNIQILLEHKADTKIKNGHNHTPVELDTLDSNLNKYDPLEISTIKEYRDQSNKLNLVRLEISHKLLLHQIDSEADPSDNKGLTVLHKLSVLQEPNVLEEYLVSHPEDINKTVGWSGSRWYGFSPLHLAITYRRGKNVVILIKYGADLWLQNEKGETPSSLLFNEVPPTSCDRFLDEYADFIIKEPKVLGILAKLKCRSGLNHFHIVCGTNSLEAVECFLRNTADPKERAKMVNTRNNQGDTPLHSLLRRNDEVSDCIVRLLLENGADPNARDKHMRTPLHLAVDNKSNELIDLLVSYGADVDAQDLLNRTPLHHFFTAKRRRYAGPENVEKLLYHGADISLIDYENRTPFSYIYNRDSLSRLRLPPGIPRYTYAMLEYVTKVQVIGMYVSQKVKEEYSAFIGSSYDRNRFEETKFTEACFGEIEILKSTGINSYATLHDILVKSRDEMAIFCDNTILKDLVDSDDFAKKFPLYGNLIKSQIKKGLIRRSFLQTCGPSLDKLFKMSLPLLCGELISHHLSNQDLKNVDEIFNKV